MDHHRGRDDADTGDAAVEFACAVLPDVVLMDLQMPNLNGVEATRAIVQNDPTPRR